MQEKSRKILILATSYLPLIGGAELAVKYLTDGLDDFSFDLVTARTALNLNPFERIGNVNIFRAENYLSGVNFLVPKALLPIFIFFKARKLLLSNKYDMVYMLQASQASGAGWLLKRLGYIKQPLVLNIQEGKVLSGQNFLLKYFRKLIINSADYYTVISSYLNDFLLSQGVSQERITIIPNGVNMPIQKGDNHFLKEKLGLGSERVIITVSRLVQKNGIADIIKSLPFIKDNYSEPIRLIIVGGAEPGLSLEPDLKKLAQELGLNDIVNFVGAVNNEEVEDYLSLSDVFVRPSYSEGLGTSFLEAMANKVPIIGTPVGGIVDFLKDGQTGLYCNVGDSQDIGRKIIMILSNKELHDRLSQNGYDLVKESYTWASAADKFKRICNQLF